MFFSSLIDINPDQYWPTVKNSILQEETITFLLFKESFKKRFTKFSHGERNKQNC